MPDEKIKKQLPPGYYTACGGRIYEPERYPSVIYLGQQIFFCNRACLRAFEEDPERFMSGEINHPVEVD